ncbi:hypothetical protein PLIIFM63780_005480 [Purpureocillium lilacinum]|uniref:Galactose-proton symport n=1 Tax=Purpureocillium lilacinum TaxID=33203 RepID=A0ABR0C896_PURLI|nr:hypothetical protein Purlil1_3554 [Purpureocillium lilacinum]GJN81944.1 hypothetical protein PLIIFM63780_005480 [Purpureocillium lilacinum]
MAEFTPFWEQPSHPGLIQVVKGNRPYTSAAYSLVLLPPGALFAHITTATTVAHTTYTSVATGSDSRIELNSDLVYCNHSCQPSLVFDMARLEVRVSDDRPLRPGDALTFFYPSTEWDMVQPFRCECGADDGVCLGRVAGASVVEPQLLMARWWLNEHVRDLVADKMQAAGRFTAAAAAPARKAVGDLKVVAAEGQMAAVHKTTSTYASGRGRFPANLSYPARCVQSPVYMSILTRPASPSDDGAYAVPDAAADSHTSSKLQSPLQAQIE